MECVLNTLTLPIKTEQNHLSGDCYCYLCSCGIHTCPSNSPYKKILPSKMYFTTSKMSYSPKLSKKIKPYIREGEILHSTQKMDFETISRKAFQITEEPYLTSKSPKSLTPSPLKFFSNSTYRANYPNWQSYQRVFFNSTEKYFPSPLKFNFQSTYGHDFLKHDTKNTEKKFAKNTPNLLGSKTKFTELTTNQATYRKYRISSVPKQRIISEDKRIPTNSVKIGSTYQKSFLPHLQISKVLTKKEMRRTKRL